MPWAPERYQAINARRERVRVWMQEETAFLRANYLTMSDVDIGDALRRSDSAVRRRREALGLTRRRYTRPKLSAAERHAATIREMWRKHRMHEIGEACGISESTVGKIARCLGLGPSGFPGGGARTAAVPAGPKGYSPEQREWAAANRTVDREAALVWALTTYAPAMPIYGGVGGSR